MKPFLEWPGGKTWLLPEMRMLYSKHRGKRIVEPFAGGLAFTFDAEPHQALANDINRHLINMYQHLQAGSVDPCNRHISKREYYRLRDRFNYLIEVGSWKSAEAAQLFITIQHNAYSGFMRFNASGFLNIDYSKLHMARSIHTKDAYIHFLQNVELQQGDFSQLKINANDFLFVDPPYDLANVRYAQNEFTWNDQIRLLKWLDNFPNPMAITNYGTQRIMQLYELSGFTIRTIKHFQRIAYGQQKAQNEILATRNV